jgi:hypothetical protein
MRAMTKPIPDKAEVALEYPEKLYIGTFERTARFDAHLDETGISLSLHRTVAADVRKTIRMHFHCGLFAQILRDLAKTVASRPAIWSIATRCGTARSLIDLLDLLRELHAKGVDLFLHQQRLAIEHCSKWVFFGGGFRGDFGTPFLVNRGGICRDRSGPSGQGK